MPEDLSGQHPQKAGGSSVRHQPSFGIIASPSGVLKQAGTRLGLRRRRPYADLCIRQIHPTAPREVVPIILAGLGIAAAATTVRYLVRAGQRARELELQEQGQAGGTEGPKSGLNDGGLVGPAYGVDMGATSLRIAFANAAGKLPEVIENKEGSRWTPAVVQYRGAEALVGALARAQRWQDPGKVIYGLPPLLGLPWDSPIRKALEPQLTYKLMEADGRTAIEAPWRDGGVLQAEEAAEALLRNLFELKEHKVGSGGACVMSVPGHYEEQQVQELTSAGNRAGLNVIATVREPVAALSAALESGVLSGDQAKGLVAVLDIGGRGLHCSLVDIYEPGGWNLVSSQHSESVGGELLDTALVEHLNKAFKRQNRIDLLKDSMALTRLYEAAEAAKVELSKSQATGINVPFITADASGPKHLSSDLTRAQFERIVDELLWKAQAPCKATLAEAGLDRSKLSAVLLVGGCSRIPAVQAMAADVFGKPPVVPVAAEEMAVLGATIAARKAVYGS